MNRGNDSPVLALQAQALIVPCLYHYVRTRKSKY
jgi:hypothetical protein